MTPAETRSLADAAKRFGVELDVDAVARLDRFLTILAEWNRRVRLTGERTVQTIIEQHIVDSLAPVPHLPATGLVADVGSGAGFPGIVIGCVRPDLDVVLIESRRRRTSFLREAIRTIPLPRARALEVRAEEVGRDPAVRLDSLLALAEPLLAPHGLVIAMQTPRTAVLAADVAAGRMVRLIRRADYMLSSGACRALLIFRGA
jgi:16S rRNA (guanine527-N7)-methyltransferase